MKLLHRLLLLCVCVTLVRASTEPLYGESFQTTHNSRGNTVIFPPDLNSGEQQLPYFADNLNFDAIDGRILIGAADKLYVLDKDLNIADGGEYRWNSSSSCTQQDDRLCRNHIRIYQRPPHSDSSSNSLFVCGTQSGVQPQCRLLNVSGSRLIERGDPNPTRLISAHPDFPGFGDFRKESSSDNVYFAANFKNTDSMSFDISYQQVNINSSGESVTTSRLYGWQEGDEFWLASPVVFVDFERINYATTPGQEELFQFYFVFLREKQARETKVISQVLRLCRNDAGVNQTIYPGNADPDPTSQIFTSFMKARIFCEREMPPGTQFVGAQDFRYDEIWSVAFNNLTGGRFHERRPYVHTLYGAFSGPRIGPVGTAICAYRADMGNPSSSDGLTGGIFDVFRNDVINPRTGEELENDYLECRPGGRSPMDSQRTDAVQDVRQIGENPLLIFEGFYVTQMVVDQVCIVRRDGSSCVNQDVLFLGTSDGRVLKAVFGTDVSSGSSSILPIFPIVTEEIQLDDTNPVKEMKIENADSSSKQLYIVTLSRIYRLPLERCSRHQTNITACIGSRDPYCVWDSSLYRCMASSLSADGSQDGAVPVYLQQNIHRGTVELPEVGFNQSSYTVSEEEGMNRLSVSVISNTSIADGVVQVDINDLTAKVGVNVFPLSNPIDLSFFEGNETNSTFRAEFMIEVRKDGVFSGTGNLQFQLSLRNTLEGAVFFRQQNVTVTIIDADGTLIRVGLGGLGSSCVVWKDVYSVKAVESLTSAISRAIGGNYPKENIINPTFNCSKMDEKYITFTGALLTTDSHSVSDLLDSVQSWAEGEPKIEIPPDVVVVVDKDCSVRTSTLGSTCQMGPEQKELSPDTGASSAGPTVSGLAAAFVIVCVIAACLVVVVVVLLVMLKSKKNVNCPPSDSAKVKPESNDFYSAVEASIEVPQPLTQSGVSGGSSGLAGRRGSKDLELHFKNMPPYQNMVSETNPRSSDPLLGRKFFTDSDEVDPSSTAGRDTVEYDGSTGENHQPSNGIQIRTSVEINEKIDLSFENRHHVSEQHV